MWHPRGWEDRWVTAAVSAPAPWARGQEGNHLHRAQCCTGFVFLLRPPLLHEHQNKTQTANAAGELLLLDCIDRGGPSLQRKVHLGCSFPAYFYLQQCTGNPERHGYSFQTRSPLGLLSTVRSRATASESLRRPVFRRLQQERGRESTGHGLRVPPAPLYLIVWAAGDALFLGMMSSLEAPNGDGVGQPGIAFHQRTKSALGTFAQPHSISRGAGTGLWNGGAEHSVTTSGSPSVSVCFGGPGQGQCAFGGRSRRPWASAIALGVKIWSGCPQPAATGALWLVGRSGLWGARGRDTPSQHRHRHSQPVVRGELPRFCLCWGRFSQLELGAGSSFPAGLAGTGHRMLLPPGSSWRLFFQSDNREGDEQGTSGPRISSPWP